MKTAKEYWKERFGEYPQNDSEKLAVAMMQEYAQEVVKNNAVLPHVSGSFFVEKRIPDKMLKAKDFVIEFISLNDKPPSYAKIAEHFGICRTAAYHRMKYFRELMVQK